MPYPPAMSRPFLNVESSALGRPWRDRLDDAGRACAGAMVQQLGLNDLLARVLAGRGVAVAGALDYLEPSLRLLMPDPMVLQGMAQAIARLVQAVQTSETIGIFGDYDVDGATSSALLAQYLEAAGCRALIHIPDRIFEGYGPNAAAIETLQAAGAHLLVTVDCGTTSHAVLAGAKAAGLDCIVLDHHQAPAELPDAIIVNPNRQDDLSGLGQLCAAGVVYMVLVGLSRALRGLGFWHAGRPAPDLLEALDLVALATVADVAALTGLNRAFVTKGLAVMRERKRPGLRALMDVAAADGPPRPYHLGFLVGPRINAGGRIGDAALGARLLMEHDDAEAARIAAELDRLNRERQVIEKATVDMAEAEALASLGLADKGACVVTAGQGWHPGVVGLVAARLREKFGRPAFAIAFAGDTGTGSARSVPGIDLGRIVRLAVDRGLVLKGGGHAMAAGITVTREKLGALRAFLEENLAEPVARARAGQALLIDAALNAGAAQPGLVEALEKAGPYGSGNPEPVFAFPNHLVKQATEVGTGHIKITAAAGDNSSIDGIAFRAAGTALGAALLAARGEKLHLAGELSLNRWGGRVRVQLRVLDCAGVA